MRETDAGLVMRSPAEVKGENGKNTDTSFADLLNEYDYENPQRGQILDGEVLMVHGDTILVDVGLKRDAFVPRQDLDRLDDTTLESLEPGTEVKVYVMRPYSSRGDLIVSINKALEHEDWQRAEDLLSTGEVVEAEVTGTNRGGVLVQFGRLQAFVPQSHLTSTPRGASDEERRQAKERLIGQTLILKVIDLERRRNRLVLSERAARHAARQTRLAALEVGQVLEGRVVNLQNYGAFVDIGGVDGLIHVSELDHHRVEHPADILSVGDEIKVFVKSVDIERGRIGLSRKELLPNPWDTVETHYQVGDLVSGTVTNVVDFGAFVALPNGLEGLVHVSKMATYGMLQPADLVGRGDQVLVRITEIDPYRERIALSLDAVSPSEKAEWMEAHSQADPEEQNAPDTGEGDTQSEPDPQPSAVLITGEVHDVEEG